MYQLCIDVSLTVEQIREAFDNAATIKSRSDVEEHVFRHGHKNISFRECRSFERLRSDIHFQHLVEDVLARRVITTYAIEEVCQPLLRKLAIQARTFSNLGGGVRIAFVSWFDRRRFRKALPAGTRRWDPTKEGRGGDGGLPQYFVADSIRFDAAIAEVKGDTQRALNMRVAAARAEMARTIEDARQVAMDVGCRNYYTL